MNSTAYDVHSIGHCYPPATFLLRNCYVSPTRPAATTTLSLACGPLGYGAHLSVRSHHLQSSQRPSQEELASQPKTTRRRQTPASTACATTRLSPFVRQPPARRPWAAPPPYQVAPTRLANCQKEKKNRSPFLPLISVDLSVHSRCAAWAIWPRKLGVEQGGRCCRHGVIRAPDWDLRGCGVEGQCCFSLGESLRCDGGWVCSLIDSWSFDMSFV